jgi:hypothetical protein
MLLEMCKKCNSTTTEKMEKYLCIAIEILKKELDSMLEYRALDDKFVINISQTLDVLVNEHYKLKKQGDLTIKK